MSDKKKTENPTDKKNPKSKKSSLKNYKLFDKKVEASIDISDANLKDADNEKVIEQSMLAKKHTEKKKKQKKMIFYGSIVFTLVAFVYWGMQPIKLGIKYGICKVLAEQLVEYPTTLRYSSVSEDAKTNSLEMWFTHTDSFGQLKLERMFCFYEQDEAGNLRISEAIIGKREIPSARLELFNFSIPSIIANPPNMDIPAPLPNDLENLEYERNRFIKPIF